MMKHFLLFTLVIGLFAGQASAALYELSAATAVQLRDISFSDSGSLNWVGYNDGTGNDPQVGIPVYNPGSTTYGENMYYAVGFQGNLLDTIGDSDSVASVQIGANYSGQTVLDAIKAAGGSYDGFRLPISNDNDDNWSYKLYVDHSGVGGYYESSSWTTLTKDTQTTLTLYFQGSSGSPVSLNFGTLSDIGFVIQSTKEQDDYHTSVVPVPAAVILGILGMGVAGLKLRKFA